MNKWQTIPNYLTLARLFLIAPTTFAIMNQMWLLGSFVFLSAVATDVLDGYLARKLHQSSAFGGIFDHSTDALFVSTGLACFALQDLIVGLLPVLVVLSFIQYVMDSKALAGQALVASHIGRANGICYFVLLGTTLGLQHAGLTGSPFTQAIWAISWILCISTIISMIDRAIALWRKPRKAN